MAIIAVFGPDAHVDYDREYEESPPTETPPALVPPLLRRAVLPESNEFTATLFDLVRRGYFTAVPVPSTDNHGAGDIELRRGDGSVPLAEFEVPVARVLEGAVADGSVRLSHLGAHIEKRRENVLRFDNFRSAVKAEIESRCWYTFTVARVLLLASIGLFVVGMAGSALLYSSSDRATLYFGAAAIEGAGLLFHASWIAKLVRRRRRTAEGQLEAKRWEAFRRYLTDFPRLRDVPAASIELWERYLVYGIALGVAQRVLAGAQLYRLESLSHSPILWLGLDDGAGGGADRYALLGGR